MPNNGFKHVFQEWQIHWAKCIEVNGGYLEKDYMKVDILMYFENIHSHSFLISPHKYLKIEI